MLTINQIANFLQFIPTLGGLWANSLINRREQTKTFLMVNFVQAIVFLMLKAYRGMASTLYYCVTKIYMLVTHKEEKIVLKPKEALILGIPFIIIGIIGYVTGGLFVNIFVGFADFADANIFVIKNKKARFIFQSICVIIWGIYMMQVGNYVGAFECLCTTMVLQSNVAKIAILGEKSFYKEMVKSEFSNKQMNEVI